MMHKETPDAPMPVCEAPPPQTEGEVPPELNAENARVEETVFEMIAGYCYVLVVCSLRSCFWLRSL